MSHLSNDPHDAILDLLPAYALGALDEPDAARVAQHLAACPACSDELRAYEDVAAALAASAPPVPAPPGLEQRLMQGVTRRARQTAHSSPAGPRPSLLDRLLGWRALRWAVPAIALVGLLIALAVGAQPARAPIRIPLSGTDAAPDAYGTLTITGSSSAVLSVAELPPLDESQQYQLWLVLPDGSRDSGAVFSVEPDGSAEVPVALQQPPDGYIRYGITIEPAGGSPGPTGPGVLRSDS